MSYLEPRRQNPAEGEHRAQQIGTDIEHDREVDEALQLRQESGYKPRWRISWGQLFGWLIAAAIVVGLLLLLLHTGLEH